eukprot:CAMPEP_0115537860 /NCGR_PEP_ID=MMETSP0271-20121206/88550_1 /TAXON_ID=71861 /ORGANISM="Scrippsiella trochoidea, Strain CCMP3099" /LENGTH=650 /DNA_ID=CAMNT_0002970677 /DNA_START=37 /DNA_END=1989 /DNA_ORIENTATION=+
MEEVEILPGDYSEVGRVTGRNLEKLRTYCDLSRPETSPKAPDGGNESHPGTRPSTSMQDTNLESPKALGSTFPRRMKSLTMNSTSLSTVSTKAPTSPLGSPVSPWSRSRARLKAARALSASAAKAEPIDSPEASPKSSSGPPTSKWQKIKVRLAAVRALGLKPCAAATVRPLTGAAAAAGAGKDDGSMIPRKVRIALGEDVPPVREVPARPSLCFSALGPDKTRYCKKSGILHGRFPFPVNLEEKPEVGRYTPSYGMVVGRYPEWNCGDFPKTPSKKEKEADINTIDPFSHIDMSSPHHSFASAAAAPPSGPEQIDVATARRPLEKSQDRTRRDALLMHEMSPHAGPWGLQDIPSSNRHRHNILNFKHLRARGKASYENYFEPAKYNIKYDLVDSPIKVGAPLKSSLSRARSQSGQMRHQAPKDVLRVQGAKDSTHPDRSLQRSCSAVQPRITNVNDFDTEIERPPLMRPPQVYYDDSNPEVSAEWLERRLNYNSSTADRMVIPRQDHAPDMMQALPRGGCRGSRLLESDLGVLQSLGRGAPESSTQTECSVEQAKEVPSRQRPDLGVKHFEHYVGRQPSRVCGEYSSLRKPRSMAAPDFERRARSGFTSTALVERPLVMEKNRTHEALATWAVDGVDDEEALPPPWCIA